MHMRQQAIRQSNYRWLLVLAFLLCGGTIASASSIDATDKYAWGTIDGWINFAPTNGNVTVTDSAITGYAWSANGGWINFAPTNGGVQNDGQGNLSGFAWDTSNGWISFQGVTIDSGGLFHGQATGVAADGTQNIITFDCTHCRVVTTWRPSGANAATSPVSIQTKKRSSNNVHATRENLAPIPNSPTAPVSPIEPPASQAIPGTYPHDQSPPSLPRGTSGGGTNSSGEQEPNDSGTFSPGRTYPEGETRVGGSQYSSSTMVTATGTKTTTTPQHSRTFAIVLGSIALLALLLFLARSWVFALFR